MVCFHHSVQSTDVTRLLCSNGCYCVTCVAFNAALPLYRLFYSLVNAGFAEYMLESSLLALSICGISWDLLESSGMINPARLACCIHPIASNVFLSHSSICVNYASTETMIIPRIGFNVEKVQYKNVQFTVWDVGGQEKLRPLWRHYFNNTDGLGKCSLSEYPAFLHFQIALKAGSGPRMVNPTTEAQAIAQGQAQGNEGGDEPPEKRRKDIGTCEQPVNRGRIRGEVPEGNVVAGSRGWSGAVKMWAHKPREGIGAVVVRFVVRSRDVVS
eukprot:Gb_41119 [translate_table: standard]